jgi:hypothetical protein
MNESGFFLSYLSQAVPKMMQKTKSSWLKAKSIPIISITRVVTTGGLVFSLFLGVEVQAGPNKYQMQ